MPTAWVTWVKLFALTISPRTRMKRRGSSSSRASCRRPRATSGSRRSSLIRSLKSLSLIFVVLPELNRSLDIFVLRGLDATDQDNDDRIFMDSKVEAIPRIIIDAHFKDAIGELFPVAEIA